MWLCGVLGVIPGSHQPLFNIILSIEDDNIYIVGFIFTIKLLLQYPTYTPADPGAKCSKELLKKWIYLELSFFFWYEGIGGHYIDKT